jgi:gas vesicle protein
MMIETMFIGGVVGIVVAIVASLVALKIQQRTLDKTQDQQQAWEHAQQSRQQQWKVQLERRMNEFEQTLDTQVRQLHTEWYAWKAKEAKRVETVKREYASAVERAYREHEVAGLPHIDHIPITAGQKSQLQRRDPYWRPANLQDADLSHRDLSQRYLGQANLRNAQMVNINLYMSDLSGACLAGANLIGANLIGANLKGADLSGATLTEANVLVADLNNAALLGANLLGVRNLTVDQVYTTLYDATTQFDPELGITLPHTRQPRTSVLLPLPASADQQLPLPDQEIATNHTLANVAEPESPRSTSSPDTTSFTQQPTEASPASSPLSLDDSLYGLTESGLPVDKPENTRTEESDTNFPKRRRNGRKRAKAN